MRFETPLIRAAADDLAGRLRDHRRRLHRRPELGFAEHETAAYIEGVLDELGVPHRRLAGTGVVGVIRGEGTACIAVRADMDALPVTEAAGRDGYRSEVEGLSHACGHDAHVAIALGLAELLCRADRLPGTVALYFQPAEEGPGGAAPMVLEGALDDPVPQAVIAVHVSSRHPAGVVAHRSGPSTGSNDDFTIVVHGEGGHAAHPDTAIDAIPIAAQIVLGVQQLVSREVDPVRPAVVTFGEIHGGTRHNVIASTVRLVGTIRATHEHTRQLLLKRVPEVARGVAATYRATVGIDVEAGYAAGFNDPVLTELMAASARAVLGEHAVVPEVDPTLGGEDFYAFGSTGIPVSMVMLGIANAERGIVAPHHSPGFDLEEDALPHGVALFGETIRRWFLAKLEQHDE